MTRRKLRSDELELWQKIAHTTTPLPNSLQRPKRDTDQNATRTRPEPEVFSTPVRHPSKNESHLPVSPPTWAVPGMDRKQFRKMKRGKLVPEARLDLHGMTLNQAHPELIQFVHSSFSRGLRLVLVITGKGQRDDPYDPAPRRRGVLKQQVPMWLRMPPLASLISEITESHIRHGGGGAYYVYLRRNRV